MKYWLLILFPLLFLSCNPHYISKLTLAQSGDIFEAELFCRDCAGCPYNLDIWLYTDFLDTFNKYLVLDRDTISISKIRGTDKSGEFGPRYKIIGFLEEEVKINVVDSGKVIIGPIGSPESLNLDIKKLHIEENFIEKYLPTR